jgi:uncharacterized protein involved in outer membrane biogenesis
VTLTADDLDAPEGPRHKPLWPWAAGTVGVIVLAIVVFLLLFQWNWLRPPLAAAISARLNRPVAIQGNLEVHPWSWTPTASVNGLVIGNTPWAGPAPLARITRFTVSLRLWPLLFGGRVVLPLVDVENPQLDLVQGQGRNNWTLGARPGAAATPTPRIGHLIIRDGAVRYADAGRRLTFAGVMSSQENGDGTRGAFTLSGSGRLRGNPFHARVFSGPLINIDPARPYGFTAGLDTPTTHLQMTGSIARPFDLARVSGRFTVRGDDLADVYEITGLALPNSPPYALSANFLRADRIVALWAMAGTLGKSDVEGSISVDSSTGRPFLRANVSSRRLRLADLAAITGGTPRHAAPGELSASQRIEAARLAAEHRILPDASLDASKVRGLDARAIIAATTVDAGSVPIRDLAVTVNLDHGLLTLDPIGATFSQGRLTGMIRIDARHAVQTNAIDLRLSDASLATLAPPKTSKTGKVVPAGKPPLEGSLWVRARLSGSGSSIRAAAAHANGAVVGVIPSGKVSKTIADLLGLDLQRTAFQLITRNKDDTPVRCGVADFEARNGTLTAAQVVFDTGVVKVTGAGTIDLANERMDLSFTGKPKKISFAKLNAPITVTGPLGEPKLGVNLAKAAPQAAVAVAIGVFAAPVAAILPFVFPNTSKNADCAALLGAAAKAGTRS